MSDQVLAPEERLVGEGFVDEVDELGLRVLQLSTSLRHIAAAMIELQTLMLETQKNTNWAPPPEWLKSFRAVSDKVDEAFNLASQSGNGVLNMARRKGHNV
jgi:hypothetical protein